MKMPKTKQTENEVKKAVTTFLSFNGYEIIRINNVGIWNETKKCHIFHGTPGVADLYAVKPGDYPLWIETKATGKKPTDDQNEFGSKVNKTFGTFWIWCDSLDMFITEFNKIMGVKGECE